MCDSALSATLEKSQISGNDSRRRGAQQIHSDFDAAISFPLRIHVLCCWQDNYELLENLVIVAIAITVHCNDCVCRLTQWMKIKMKNSNYLRPHQVIRAIGITVVAAILIAGCASVPPPIEQMAVARAAVSNANSAGANEFAPVLLKSAMDKMAAAELAMTAKEYVRARELAEQAQVDAQLAGATSRSVKAQKAADAVAEDSRVLRKEIDRKTK